MNRTLLSASARQAVRMSCSGWSASIHRAGAGSAENLFRIWQATTADVARAGGLNLEKPVLQAGQGLQPLRGLVVGDRGRALSPAFGVSALLQGGQRPGSLSLRAWLSDPSGLASPMATELPAAGLAPCCLPKNPIDRRRADRGAAQNARDPKPRPTSLWHGCLPAKTGTVSCVLAPAPGCGTSSVIHGPP